MSGRIAILATTVADGRAYAEGVYLATDVVAIVTPRSKAGVRGLVADHVTMTEAWPALDAKARLRTLDAVLPCMATSPCRPCHDELTREVADLEAEIAEAAR